MKKKGLVFALGCLGFVLLVAATGYLWVKHSAWSKVESLAAEHGVLLEEPSLALSWKGSWHFVLHLENLRGRLQSPFPATGSFVIPEIFVDLDYDREASLLRIHTLQVKDLEADLELETKPSTEPPETDRLEIPEIASPVIRLEDEINLPVNLDLKDLKLRVKRLELKTHGETNALMTAQDLDLRGQAAASPKQISTVMDLELPFLELKAELPGKSAALEKASLKFHIEGANQPTDPKTFRLQLTSDANWRSLSFSSTDPANPSTARLWMKDEGGALKLTANPDRAELSIRGEKMRSSLSKKATDWSLELLPVRQTELVSELRLKVQVPQLLDLDTKILSARKLQLDRPSADLDGRFSLHPDLALLILDEMPLQFQGQIRGDFKLELSAKDQMNLVTKMTGQGLGLNLQIEADLTKKSGQSSGNFSLNFDNQKIRFADKSFSGRLAVPFKLIWRNQERMFVETELQMQKLSIKSKDLELHNVSGVLPVKQSWSFHKDGWDLNPRLAMNAFARADFESFAPLERSDNLLRVEKLRLENKSWGPVELELRINQNLLRSTGWRLGLKQGRFEGAFLLDLKLENPKMGLLIRAYRVHAEEILPTGLAQGDWLGQPLSFYMGMDWDIAKAEAEGRIDWSDINSPQVLGLLDILDPQYENKIYNQARTLLSTAYPTRVLVDLKGRVADIRINTNIVALPEVRNVPLSPYLLRANERLYENDVYRRLRRGL